MIFQNGVPAIAIGDLLSNFNIEQGNIEQRHFLKNLTHAKWCWKEIFLRSIWEMRQVVLNVDPDTNSIRLPYDMQGQVNVSVVDHHGNKQLIGYNPNMNTVNILCSTVCSCKCGGVDTLCGAFDHLTMTTETVNIKGTDYTKTTWIKHLGGGKVAEFTKTPVFVSSGLTDVGTVQYQEDQRVVCNLEVNTSTGCIKATDQNFELFRLHCGCYTNLPFNNIWGRCNEKQDVPATDSAYGYWNWNAAAGNIIQLKDVKAKQVIVGIQSSGEVDGQEIVVPEYALDAVQVGILYRQALFNPTVSFKAKKEAKNLYRDAKMDLNKFLRPVSMHALRNLQCGIPLW